MMVGNLALHQVQPFTVLSSPSSQASDQRPREQQQQQLPCLIPLAQLRSMEEFRQAHAQFIKLGLDRVPRCAGELLSACALSGWGSLDYARSIFSALEDPGTFDFNTMIRAHVYYSEPNAALLLYKDMVEAGVVPDDFTFPFVLKACAGLSDVRAGLQAHAHALKSGFGEDAFVQNSLINLYGKCREINAACRVFEQMGSNKTVASWSAMLAAHNRMGLSFECLGLFGEMISLGVRPDESSLVSVLSSCAHLGALGVGQSVHCLLLRGFSGLNSIVQTSLVDMYVKCGLLEKGVTVFDRMTEKNKWAYSAVISGMAMHGDGEKSLMLFADMLRDRIEPDEAIYVGVLSACSNAGLVDEGLRCFDRMRFEHRIAPTAQHYGCIVTLLSRSGKVEEACRLIQSMPVELERESAWRALLSACKVHGNLELAKLALSNLKELHCAKAGDYVILSNMYAKAGRWDDAARARTEIADRGLYQSPGFSRVEVKGKTHTFVSMDRSHPDSDEVYEMLHQMQWQLRFEGYFPDTSEVPLRDADEEEKIQALNGQSQKLAIAFGLLKTSEGDAIRVTTNVKMSSECHAYTGLISKVFEREIVVRDRSRFHHFRRGVCSCRDKDL